MSWGSMRGAMEYLHVGHKFLMGAIRSGELDARVMPSQSGSDAANAPLRINTDDLDALARSWPTYAAIDQTKSNGIRNADLLQGRQA